MPMTLMGRRRRRRREGGRGEGGEGCGEEEARERAGGKEEEILPVLQPSSALPSQAQAGSGGSGGAYAMRNTSRSSPSSSSVPTTIMRTGAGVPPKKQTRVASGISSSAASSALSGVSHMLRGVVGVPSQGLFRHLEGGEGPVAMPGGGLPRAPAGTEDRMEKVETESE